MSEKKKYTLTVEVETFGVHSEIEIHDKLKGSGLKILSIREDKSVDDGFRPVGLTQRDTLEDAFMRADRLSSVGRHSGMLVNNKDLRRIVLLAHHARYLFNKLQKGVKK